MLIKFTPVYSLRVTRDKGSLVPTQLFITISTESWAGPGNEARTKGGCFILVLLGTEVAT